MHVRISKLHKYIHKHIIHFSSKYEILKQPPSKHSKNPSFLILEKMEACANFYFSQKSSFIYLETKRERIRL